MARWFDRWWARKGEDYLARVIESGENGTARELLDRFYVVNTQTDKKPNHRISLLHYSLRHPELLDASGEVSPKLQRKIKEKLNRTAADFFPAGDYIPKEKYYSGYQVRHCRWPTKLMLR